MAGVALAVLAAAVALQAAVAPGWSAWGGGAGDGGIDARVVVGAPGGRIDDRVRSFNVASWEPDDWSPAHPDFVALVAPLEPALVRFPPGHDGQHTFFDPTNRLTEPPAGYSHLLRGDDLDRFVATARAIGAEPMLEVNTKTGTPAMAAQMVRYANVERGHGITWFELGNEPDLGGHSTSPQQEAARFLRFAAAMRAVDPDIRLVGGAFMSGANAFGTDGRDAWLPAFAAGVGGQADAYSWHWYPLDSDQERRASGAYPTVGHLLQERSDDWPPAGLAYAQEACRQMEATAGADGAEHWVTELGPDSGARQAPGITDGQAAAVWFADAVPRLAECGADAVFQFALRQQDGSVLVLMTHDRQPTPAWGTYRLLAAHYRGEWLRTTVEGSGAGVLAAHAARHDGTTCAILANKGDRDLVVAVDLDGAGDRAPETGQTWTLEADGPTSTTARVNGDLLDRGLAVAGFTAREQRLDSVPVPAYGVVAVCAPPA